MAQGGGQDCVSILSVPAVRSALREAWRDSQPGISGGHEEGGFVVRGSTGTVDVVRWARGATDSITLPPHPECKISGMDILATFHTHPNTGADYLQEPTDTDVRAVRDDPDLKGASYVGEIVISQAGVYLVSPSGEVSEVADVPALLTEE